MRHPLRILFAIAVALALPASHPPSVAAQTLEWIRQFGGPDGSAFGPRSVSADAFGNVFLSGVLRNKLGEDFYQYAFFGKYDSAGIPVWTRTLNSAEQQTAWCVSADGFGNVYVQGDTTGDTFGTNAGSFDVWLAKYDGNGNELWGRQLGTSGVDEYGQVAANPLGGAYISGRTTGSLGGPNGGGGDQFLASYSADGELLWSRQLSSPGSEPYSRLSADNLGNVYIAGRTSDSLFGPNAGGQDAYLAKYNREGTLLWGRQFGTSANDGGLGGVAADELGNVFVLGHTAGSLGGPNAGDDDIFLTKFHSDGVQEWTQQFGGPLLDTASYFVGGGGLAADGNGNVHFAASVDSTRPTPNSVAGGDILVGKYDANGNLVWEERIGTSEIESGARISSDGLGNVYFSGSTGGKLGGPLADGSAFIGKFFDAASLPASADFDNDADVDGADFLTWQRSAGLSTGATREQGDANADGMVNAGDLAVWNAQFGSTQGAGSLDSQFVPEPTTFGLLIAFAIHPLVGRRRQRYG